MPKMTSATPVGQVITSPTAKAPGLPKSTGLGSAPLAKTPPGPHGSLTSDDSSYPSSSDESSNGQHGTINTPNTNNPLPSIFPASFNLSPRLTSNEWESAPQNSKLPYSEADAKRQREPPVVANGWKSEVEGDGYFRSSSANGTAPPPPPPPPQEDDWPGIDPISLFPATRAKLQGHTYLTIQQCQPLPPPGVSVFGAPGMAISSIPVPHSPVILSPPPPKPETKNKKLQTNVRVSHCDQEVQVEPLVGSHSIQTDPPPTGKDAAAQTELTATPLVPLDQLTPPKLSEDGKSECD